MSLHGWRQLAEWSIEHSCMTEIEKRVARSIFANDWEVFCDWVVKEYDEFAAKLSDLV